MANADETLRVQLTADGIAELVAAMRQVGNEVKRQGHDSEKAWHGFGETLKGVREVLGTIGIALSIEAFVESIRHAVEFAHELELTAEKLGTTSAQVAGLAFAFKEAGSDIKGAAPALGQFARNLVAFENGGGKAAAAVTALGLKAQDFKDKDLASAFTIVAQRVAQYHGGIEKAALATQLFGRRGLELLPVLNTLGREGMGELQQKIARLYSPEAIANAATLQRSFEALGYEVQGLALNFGAGLAPALVQEIGVFTKGIDDAADAAKLLGEGLGVVFKIIAAIFITGGALVAAFAAQLVNTLTHAWAAVTAAMTGHFAQARHEIAQLFRGAGSIVADEVKTIGQAWGNVFTTPKLDAESEAERRRLAAAQLASRNAERRALAEGELNVLKEKLAAEEKADKDSYDRGLLTLDAYYARRIERVKRLRDAEINAANKKIAAGAEQADDSTGGQEAANRARALAEIQQARVHAAAQIAQLESEQYDARVKSDLELRKLEATMFDSRRAEHARRLLDIDAETEKFRIALGQRLTDEKKIAQEVHDFRAQLLAKENSRVAAQQAGDALDEFDRARADVQARINAGLISEVSGRRTILALEKESLPALEALAQAQLAAAIAAKDSDAVRAAQAMIEKIRELRYEIQATASEGQRLKATFNDSLKAQIKGFFAGARDDAKGLADAVRLMALDIINALRQLVAEMLATHIMDALAKFAPSIFGAKEGGHVQTKREGGLVALRDGGAVPFIPAPLRLAIGSDGRVTGPGHSREDKIPALLSHGEFVVRAQVVRQPGMLELLKSINRGTVTPTLRETRGPRRFADGGLASAIGAPSPTPTSQPLDASITVHLADGLVAGQLETPEGQKAVMRVLQRNRRGARSLLSGGR